MTQSGTKCHHSVFTANRHCRYGGKEQEATMGSRNGLKIGTTYEYRILTMSVLSYILLILVTNFVVGPANSVCSNQNMISSQV